MRALLLFLYRLMPVLMLAGAAPAAVTPEQAAQLGGGEYTPLGAERRGNAEGSIPAWEGGITAPPPGYRPGEEHVDPYPDDPVLYTISADNLEAYADKLSEGQKALLRAHPDSWHMNVYRTRRSAAYPEWVYAAIRANATTARVLSEGKGGVAGSNVSSPFPFPSSGLEVVWNHNLRWRGIRVSRNLGQAAVTRKGRYTVTITQQEIALPYAARPDDPLRVKFPNILFALKGKVIEPGLISGEGSLTIEPIDQTREPRKSWLYLPALRRVLRAPFLSDDYPAANTDNLRTVDEGDLYNGSPDHFDWKLLGKRELYIPYNAYRLDAGNLAYKDILHHHHINPALARYELHRVWVVEGSLKPGVKHIYSRRVFYVDEDSWQIAVSDSYDQDGRLWRTAEAHAMNFYEMPLQWTTMEVYYDFEQRRYLVMGLDNGLLPYRFSDSADPREFTPNALNYYIR
jgi:Protein of unknown function (DUF1329)